MVPGFLGEHAGLVKEVVVVGAGDRLELWAATWNEHRPTLMMASRRSPRVSTTLLDGRDPCDRDSRALELARRQRGAR